MMAEQKPCAARICARCGRELAIGKDPFYIVKMEILSGFDPEEIDETALEGDLRKEIAELCRKLESISQEDAEASVYKRLSFFLCPVCQKAFLAAMPQAGPKKTE